MAKLNTLSGPCESLIRSRSCNQETPWLSCCFHEKNGALALETLWKPAELERWPDLRLFQMRAVGRQSTVISITRPFGSLIFLRRLSGAVATAGRAADGGGDGGPCV